MEDGSLQSSNKQGHKPQQAAKAEGMNYRNCIWRRFKSRASAKRRKSWRDGNIREGGFQPVNRDNICATHLKAEELISALQDQIRAAVKRSQRRN